MNRKAFLIAKEIVESEEMFIQVLHLLNKVCFSCCMCKCCTVINCTDWLVGVFYYNFVLHFMIICFINQVGE